MLRRQPYISFPEKGCYTYVIAAATAAVGLFIFLPIVASLYYSIHGLNFLACFPQIASADDFFSRHLILKFELKRVLRVIYL